MGSFATAVNCMDGRVQLPVIDHLRRRCGVEHVDMVTTAGPIRHLAADAESPQVQAIHRRIGVSTGKHGSCHLALVIHHDCAGNPVGEAAQRAQLARALERMRARYPGIEVFGLWVDDAWTVHEID